VKLTCRTFPRTCWLPLSLALGASYASYSSADLAPSSPVQLTVHASRPGVRLSPEHYGVFFEEVNHAGEGGLYGELVRNRSFEDGETPAGWQLINRGGNRGSLELSGDQPLNGAQRKSLRLRVAAAGNGEAGVINEGYWGIAVRQDTDYRLSLQARRGDAAKGELVASLESASGQVYARERLRLSGADWQPLHATLRSSGTDPKARLVLTTETPGDLYLEVVSLFPEETWKERRNGMRRDLGDWVAGMKPAFVRFPGGCYVEGSRLDNAFRWKQTVGAIETRPGHPNAKWGYHSTDGLGYHEYLQWCEDNRAEPLFVINCGMACMFESGECVALPSLGEWVQDALDAVEYANGPVSSRWGALRAKHGHPKPFGLKYLEIGNENGWGATLPQYEERYARFYDALKQRYPSLQLIATTPVKSRPMDMVDDHYYNWPEWFWSNAGLYDSKPRDGANVYVGEYAVTADCGGGNLQAALAEAAFMTGMERNGDLIRKTSYAPLLVNVNRPNWNPNAIVFDSSRSYGTPSYWVQALFAEHRPDTAWPVELSRVPTQTPGPTGGIGLQTWKTQAEFKEITVEKDGATLYRSDFRLVAPGWRTLRGDWKAADGVYRQTSLEQDRRAVLVIPELKSARNYTLRLKARKLGGAEGFLVHFGLKDEGSYYAWNIGGWDNKEDGLEKVGAGVTPLAPRVPNQIETGRWYDVRVELTEGRIRCFLDDRPMFDVQQAPVPALAAVAGREEKSGDLILKVVNGTDAALPATLNLEGAGRLRREGEAVVLTSATRTDENSFDQPRKIAPVTRPIDGVSERFAYTFPARSLTILRLRKR